MYCRSRKTGRGTIWPQSTPINASGNGVSTFTACRLWFRGTLKGRDPNRTGEPLHSGSSNGNLHEEYDEELDWTFPVAQYHEDEHCICWGKGQSPLEQLACTLSVWKPLSLPEHQYWPDDRNQLVKWASVRVEGLGNEVHFYSPWSDFIISVSSNLRI